MKFHRWAGAKMRSDVGFTKVDLALVFVVVVSFGIIAAYFLGPKQSAPETTSVAAAPAQPPPPLGSEAAPPAPNEALPVVTDENWKTLMTDPVLRAARVPKADGCKSGIERPQWGFWTNNPERIQQIAEGQPQTISALKDFLCFEVGQKIQVVTFGRNPEEPVVRHLSTMAVFDILSLEISKIPLSYFASQNTTLELFESYLSRKRTLGPGARDNIIRVQPAELERPDDTLAPKVLRNGRVILKADRAEFAKLYPNALIVDVRSPQEFATGTLKNAINVPFTPSPRATNVFSWSVLNKDIATSKFNFQEIERASTGRPLVIVGGLPTDGRAFWAIHLLSDLSFPRIFYFYEGI